jgi:peptidoglycan/LPS O-acetylase OafA/YrhL
MNKKSLIKKTNYRTDVQWLRGIAVLAVVLFHFSNKLFPNGYLGVNVFFIISGFVVGPLINNITYNLKLKRKLLIDFYLRRLLRLLPAFTIIIAVSLILFFLFGPISDHGRISGQAYASFLLLGNFGAYKYGNNYFHPQPNPFIHLWSLSTEEQIYIIIPILLMVFISLKRYRLIIFYLFVGIISFILQVFFINTASLKYLGINDASGLIYYLPISHIWEFCAGAAISLSNFKILKTKYSKICNWLVLFFGALVLFSTIHMGFLGPLFSLILTSIFLIINSSEYKSKLYSGFWAWVGDRSYSIYLWHLPLIYLFTSTKFFMPLPVLIKYLLALATLLLFSNLTYKFIEIPLRINKVSSRNEIKNKLKITSTLALFSIIFVILYGLFGGRSYVESKDALPIRPWLVDKNCITLGGQVCEYPLENSRGDVLFIGDSHAGAISRTFIDAAQKNGFSASTYMWRGCPAISAINIKSVDQQNNNFLKSIFMRSTPPQYCPNYMGEARNIINANKYISVFVTSDCSWCSEEEILASAKTAVDLTKIANNVVFIGQTPVFKYPLNFGSTTFTRFTSHKPVMRSEVQETSYVQNKIFKNFFDGTEVKYIDAHSLYCDEFLCKVYENGYLFADYNHLSLAGASILYPEIDMNFQLIGRVAK